MQRVVNSLATYGVKQYLLLFVLNEALLVSAVLNSVVGSKNSEMTFPI